MVDKKNQHLDKKRVLLSFVINAVFLLYILSTFFISPVLAFESCCKCTFDGNGNNGTICLKAPTGRGCTWAETTAKDLGQGAYDIKCTFLDPQACQKIGNSDFAQCPYEPIFATDFRTQYIEQFLGFGRQKTTEQPTGPAAGTAAIVPELGVKIPGITFPDRLKVEDKYLIVPYLAIYVAGFQKIIIGISLIAAAIMIVYGGFTYIYSVNGSKIEDAKSRIKDAIIGLIIILTSVVLMANINPDTVKLKPLKIEIVEPAFPKDTGFFDYQAPSEPWNPGTEQPNATPPPPRPLKLANDKNVLNFYKEEGPVDAEIPEADLPDLYNKEVKGKSYGARMLSVCVKNAGASGELKDKTREEQLRYAAGVMNVWIREGLINSGALYARTSWTYRVGEDESSCGSGTVDPGFYFGTQATQQGWCPPLRNSLTIGLGSLNCTEAYSIAKGRSVGNVSSPISYEQISGNLEAVAGQMSSNPRAFIDYMNGLGDLQKYYSSALGFAGVPYPWTNTTAGSLQTAVQKIKNFPRSVLVEMDSGGSTCRKEATSNYKDCFTKRIGDQGFFCGDCGSTLQQYMSCVGMNPSNEIFNAKNKIIKTQVTFYNASTGENEQGYIEYGSPNLQAPGGGDKAAFLFVAQDEADWFKKY
ncbi:pilin, partial [Patescibacteria group bacterium]|nr:pilin [Patescibacteria group bacterium]